MKVLISIFTLLIVFQLFTSFADDTRTKVVHDNTGGASAKITFTAEVVKLLTIESNILVLNIGPLSAGETKILGENFNAVFHLNGVPNAKFVINLKDESYNNDGVTLEGLTWEYRNSNIDDYTKILGFPYISQLNQLNGDGWIKVYPQSITAAENVNTKTIFFEFKFNCSYYEL